MPDINTAAEAGTSLAQYGPTGVAIAALAITAVLGWLFSKGMAAQAKEHRETMQEQHTALKDVVDRNTIALQENAKATSQLTGSLPHVCKYQR